MPFWRRAARRLRALFGGAAIDRELADEIRLHLELEADDLARTRGLAPDDARRRAYIAFGGVARFAEAHRDARGVRWLSDALQDARYAVRALRRDPVFTVSAVLVLALGIGACTAVFGAIDAAILTRLPYPHDERLVRIFQSHSAGDRWSLSAVDLQAIDAQQRTFSAVGAARSRDVAVSTGDAPGRMQVGYVTSGFFRALGVSPAAGRALAPSDDRPAAPPVALVTHEFAARWGGDERALGRAVTIDGIAYTVIGVLPRAMTSFAGLAAGVWPDLQLRTPARRGPFGYGAVARLRDGVRVAEAARDLAGISERIFPLWQSSFQDREARLLPVPLRSVMLGDAPRVLGIFAAAVLLVLLIAVANVASLVVVRATARWREVSLRAVLGATRARIVRLLVTESLILALAGALVGLVIGAVGLRALVAIGPHVSRLDGAHLDARATLFAVVLALVTGVLVGAYPVLHLLRNSAGPTVQNGERALGGTRRTHAIRSAFVVTQFALALPLLAGAGLLLDSVVRLGRVNPGFDPAHIVGVSVSLPSQRYADDTAIATYWTRALARVRALPGVVDAGLGDALPPDAGPGLDVNNFDLLDHPVPPGGAQPTSPWPLVDSGYFHALGVRLLEGRMFDPHDTIGAPPVLVVSRSWAHHYVPEGNVVGRRLVSGGCTTCPPTTIIGVVSDVKYEGLGGTSDAAYETVTQGWERALHLFVRTAGPPDASIRPIVAALRSVEPAVAANDAAPLGDRIYASVAPTRNLMALVGGFAAAAVALAAVGIFGMLSYTVNTRRREIGVRMALGAQRATVVRMVLRRGVTQALAGATIGLVIAIATTRWLAGTLFDVSATDPLTLAGVTVVLLAVAVIASWLPARRAAAVDPSRAIRLE